MKNWIDDKLTLMRIGGLPTLLPRLCLTAGLAKHPFIDRNDKARFFRPCQELAWTDEAVPRTPPAQQCFRAGNLPSLERNLWLVVQDKLLLGDRLAHIGVEDQACTRPPIHVRGVESEDVSAIMLRPIHCQITVAQELLHVGTVGWVNGDTDTRTRNHLLARMQPWCADGLNDAGSHFGRILVLCDVRLQNCKLVAAETCDRIGFAHERTQTVGDLYEVLVADLVAEPVVDVFEAVEIDEVEGERPIATTRASDLAAQAV